MAQQIRVVNLETGMPNVEEARAKLNSELTKAKQRGDVALKIIHGYGSSGVGGKLKHAILRSLRKRKKEGKIRAYVAGEKFETFDETTKQIIDECPQAGRDSDLNNYNEGIAIVLL